MRNLILIFCLVILSSCNSDKKLIDEYQNPSQQIVSLLKKSKNKTLDDSVRLNLADKALTLSKELENDSLIAQSYLQLTRLTYNMSSDSKFSNYYLKSLLFSKKVSDTLALGLTHNYAAFHFLSAKNSDSAYFHFYRGSKAFKAIDKKFLTGKMLLNMAIIQKNERDYVGAEVVSVESIPYLIHSGRKYYISSVYNNLGIIADELKKITLSISYHKKALAIRKKMKDQPILVVESMNNIAVAYKNSGDFQASQKYFDSLTPFEKFLEKEPIVAARIIDNKAHLKLLMRNWQNVLMEMEIALNMRKKNNDITGIMVSYLHLSEYFKLKQEFEKSYEFAKKAKILSKRNKNYRDALKALRILTTSKSKKNDGTYIDEYYHLEDSLFRIKNLKADHFARIRYEADEKEKENKKANEKINLQEDKIYYQSLLIILLVGVAILILIILLILKRSSKFKQNIYREFNHRTRNNLIEIQRKLFKIKQKSPQTSVNELDSILNSQLLLYSILEQENHPTHVFIDEYLDKLINTLIHTNNKYDVIASFDIDRVKVLSKNISIVGLIINEFITNAYKHGFDQEKENQINIQSLVIKKKEIHIKIEVTGKKWNPKLSKGKGEGLLIIDSLAKKIHANIKILHMNNLTVLSLNFKI